MKKLLSFLLFFLFILTIPLSGQERKKVAIVLSGGGAKGTAHIGALKVIERAGVPVDIVVGTSMGSLVGGLYAIGYNAEALDTLVRGLDWSYLLSDRENLSRQSLDDRRKQNIYVLSRGLTFGRRSSTGGGFITGKNINMLLDKLCTGYADSMDFNRLPIPFACVATNLVDNSEVDFHSGRLPQALRASMAIPAVFSPVRIGKKVLVDGGLTNNYPVDVARKMGADIVIGVTVQDSLRSAEGLNSTFSILMQVVDFNTLNKYEENIANTDIHICVDPSGYSSASFNKAAIDTLIQRGEREAMNHWDDLKALKRRIGIDDSFQPVRLQPLRPKVMTERVHLTGCTFENMTPQDEDFLRGKFHLDRLDSISTNDEEEITTSMRTDLFYATATSHLVEEGDGYHLVLTAGERKTSQVNVGLRFDNEEMVAMQVNANLPVKKTLRVSSDITMRLGKRLFVGGELIFHPRDLRFSRPTVSYFFLHNDIEVYYQGDREYSILYNLHQAKVEPVSIAIRNFNFKAGLRWDYYHFSNKLQSDISRLVEFENEHYFIYQAQMEFNSEDHWYFPTRGGRFLARYAYITDNFASINGRPGISDVSASWRKSFPLTNRFTVESLLYGRMLFGAEIPHIYGNVIGGSNFGHYVEQQMPFAGVGHMEYAERHFVGVQLQGRQRMGKNHYVQLSAAVAQQAGELKSLMKTRTLIGGQLSYTYYSMFGPLGASLSYSNRTKSPYLFINLGYEF
jgi:NTE family protein